MSNNMEGEDKASWKLKLTLDHLISKEEWTIAELEDFFYYAGYEDEDEEDEDNHNRIGIPCRDAYSLHCRRFPPSSNGKTISTVMGLYESMICHLDHYSTDDAHRILMNESVELCVYQMRDDPMTVGMNNDSTTTVPMTKDWSAIMPSKPLSQCPTKQQLGMTILDLTWFQNSQDDYSNQQIYTVLQGLAQIHDPTLHAASPWYSSSNSGEILRQGLAVLIPTSCREKWEKFCVGHAIPSYQLHSIISPLTEPLPSFCCSISTNIDITLLTYRPLPPRTFIQPTLPDIIHQNPTIPLQLPNDDHNDPLYENMFWETYPIKQENDNNEETDIVIWNVRQIATPYQNAHDIFPLLIQPIIDAIPIFQKEVQENIPSTWTPWPETSHYDTHNSWTIFPICHTFPATDLSTRTWISSTCQLIPQTVEILKRICGDELRTALFSKLEADSQLNAHTGWADLANHVCRLHIPVDIPSEGTCGVWVDGCMQIQTPDNVICFDDSKVHRAFNYSTTSSRIVLILDFKRPLDRIPLGTATGDHTEELDIILQQFK